MTSAGSGGPWEAIITGDEIIELHLRGMVHGGPKQPTDARECVEGRLGNAWSAETYSQPHGVRAGLLFAVHLFFYLTQDHCFLDGNKRIAWLAMTCALLRHGLTIKATDDDAYSMAMAVAEGSLSAEGVLDWVTPRLVALSLPPPSR